MKQEDIEVLEKIIANGDCDTDVCIECNECPLDAQGGGVRLCLQYGDDDIEGSAEAAKEMLASIKKNPSKTRFVKVTWGGIEYEEGRVGCVTVEQFTKELEDKIKDRNELSAELYTMRKQIKRHKTMLENGELS